MLPRTSERVIENTAGEVNRRIREQIESNVECFSNGAPAINRRLQELDAEWDIERALETNAAIAALVGLGLGVMVNRKFLLVPAAVAGFLLQHALQGWCPPVPVFRRLSFRTAREIEIERHALKAMRGDYHGIEPGADGRASSAECVVGAASC
jgi:hypothetical protein